MTRESPGDTVSDVKVQEEGTTYVNSKRLMPQDQGLQPIPSPRDNFLHIPTSSPLNTAHRILGIHHQVARVFSLSCATDGLGVNKFVGVLGQRV